MNICDLYFKNGNLLLNEKIKLIQQGLTEKEACEHLYAFCHNEVAQKIAINILNIPETNVFLFDGNYKPKEYKEYLEWLENKINKEKMIFDKTILNPPYSRSLHLDFFEIGLKHLSDSGKLVIIEPATWLINVRKNGRSNKYDIIKHKIDGHVKSIVIENFNKEFGTTNQIPFSITTIDMSKRFKMIDCNIFGEHRTAKTIYDCNLIGEYEIIWSILEKVQKFGNMMNEHITKEDIGNEYWYAKYMQILGSNIIGCAGITDRVGMSYETSESSWQKTYNGYYESGYISTAFHYYENSISNTPLCSYDRGKHLTNKIADNIYGTKEELENWKHFIFNNKLSLFLNIVLTIDQHNNSKEFLPWLVDKQRTDEEINQLFNFTPQEIELIDITLKKYERNSPWFKRYMCGKDSVSDEEVMNFIQKINKHVC